MTVVVDSLRGADFGLLRALPHEEHHHLFHGGPLEVVELRKLHA